MELPLGKQMKQKTKKKTPKASMKINDNERKGKISSTAIIIQKGKINYKMYSILSTHQPSVFTEYAFFEIWRYGLTRCPWKMAHVFMQNHSGVGF